MLPGRAAGLSALRLRPEKAGDAKAVRALLRSAFPTSAEADLVEALRAAAKPFLSWVAASGDGAVVGQIVFTPVALGAIEAESSGAFGLAPMSVAPDRQRRGVGSQLVRAGLEACREAGARAVVVLGHPDFYSRFDFEPAEQFGLHYGAPGPNPAFQALELDEGGLGQASGLVRYHPAFDAL